MDFWAASYYDSHAVYDGHVSGVVLEKSSPVGCNWACHPTMIVTSSPGAYLRIVYFIAAWKAFPRRDAVNYPQLRAWR